MGSRAGRGRKNAPVGVEESFIHPVYQYQAVEPTTIADVNNSESIFVWNFCKSGVTKTQPQFLGQAGSGARRRKGITLQTKENNSLGIRSPLVAM